MSKVLVDREVLERVLAQLERDMVTLEGEWNRGRTLAEIEAEGGLSPEIQLLRAALKQPGVHRLIYPGGGKELSEKLWHLTFNCVTSHSGNVVHTNKLPMREMRAFIDQLCVLVDSPPPPQPAQQAVGPSVQEAVLSALIPYRKSYELMYRMANNACDDVRAPIYHSISVDIQQNMIPAVIRELAKAPQPAQQPGGAS